MFLRIIPTKFNNDIKSDLQSLKNNLFSISEQNAKITEISDTSD
jgi:hypothetical protein